MSKFELGYLLLGFGLGIWLATNIIFILCVKYPKQMWQKIQKD